ncbi:hypothetical protein R1flu_007424 [Riccia fluitans]|uniref:Uncharacterized protein n=1 Tax=Riccia fluitans TaxID=41844 RepID=A0ABD1YYT8_9MARC
MVADAPNLHFLPSHEARENTGKISLSTLAFERGSGTDSTFRERAETEKPNQIDNFSKETSLGSEKTKLTPPCLPQRSPTSKFTNLKEHNLPPGDALVAERVNSTHHRHTPQSTRLALHEGCCRNLTF